MYGGAEALARHINFGNGQGYSAMHFFWLVEEIAELADGPSGCDQLARGGYLFACDFSVARSAVVKEGGEKV
jgi:hypothetical protein